MSNISMLQCMITNMLRKYHSAFILCINHRVHQKRLKFDMSKATTSMQYKTD